MGSFCFMSKPIPHFTVYSWNSIRPFVFTHGVIDLMLHTMTIWPKRPICKYRCHFPRSRTPESIGCPPSSHFIEQRLTALDRGLLVRWQTSLWNILKHGVSGRAQFLVGVWDDKGASAGTHTGLAFSKWRASSWGPQGTNTNRVDSSFFIWVGKK